MAKRRRPWLRRAAQLGGEARAERLTEERRAEIALAGARSRAKAMSRRARSASARKAAKARWARVKAKNMGRSRMVDTAAENIGERNFMEYAVQEGYSGPRKIPTGEEQTADFELATQAGTIVCEVKSFPWTSENRDALDRPVAVGVGHPGFQRLRDAIRRAKHQLKRYEGRLTVAILCNTNFYVDLSDIAIGEAMFGGPLRMNFLLDVAVGEIVEYQGTSASGHGRVVHPEHPAPWVSAVAVLETIQPDQKRFEELVRARMDASDKPGIEEWLHRWETAAQQIHEEYPDLDPERAALRLRVFENPEADMALPKDVLSGRHDSRFGVDPHGLYGPLEGLPVTVPS